MNFSSENYAGAHPAFMEALAAANQGFEASYGRDRYASDATALLKQEFGENIEVYFTFNGTGANVFALSSMVEKHHAILCTDVAHCYVDESTAPEAFTGCRLYPVKSENGKINLDALKQRLNRIGDVHHPQVKAVTITQPTEYGTVYSIEELKAIRTICDEHDLLLHVDGARFFNAAVALNTSLKALTTEVGVDVLTLGGTKIGMLFGETVIFFNPPQPNAFKFMHKRSMQLASKTRFIAVQFRKVLENELWKNLAEYSNQLAKLFEEQLPENDVVQITHPVQTNAVFLKMPKSVYNKVQNHAGFYYWDEVKEEVRLVFCFDNTKEEVLELVKWITHYSKL